MLAITTDVGSCNPLSTLATNYIRQLIQLTLLLDARSKSMFAPRASLERLGPLLYWTIDAIDPLVARFMLAFRANLECLGPWW